MLINQNADENGAAQILLHEGDVSISFSYSFNNHSYAFF
jgi:hypothetical protein